MKKFRYGALAFVALALIGAIGAASASASGFRIGSAGGTVHGTQSEELVTSGFDLLQAECSSGEVNFSAETPEWSHWLHAGNMTSPKGCSYGQVTMNNNCYFAFYPGSSTGIETFAGTASLGPAGCGGLTVTDWPCKYTMIPQEGFNATYTNMGSGKEAYVIAKIAANGVGFTRGTFGSPGECGKEGEVVYHGSFSIAWKIQGTYAGTSVNFKVDPSLGEGYFPEGVEGLYIAGKESKNEFEQPVFEAENQRTILASQVGWMELEEEHLDGSTECETVKMSGDLSGHTSELSLLPQLEGCHSWDGVSEVEPNGCHTVFHVNNSGPPYTGNLDLTCPAGHELEITSYNLGCTERYPEQWLGAVKYKGEGSGTSHSLVATITSSGGIRYSGESYEEIEPEITKLCEGSYKDGTLRGSFSLK